MFVQCAKSSVASLTFILGKRVAFEWDAGCLIEEEFGYEGS